MAGYPALQGEGYHLTPDLQGRGQPIHLVDEQGGCIPAAIQEVLADCEIVAFIHDPVRREQHANYSETKEPGSWHYPCGE